VNRFTDRIAIVTGSSKGIGLACARRLAQEGAALVLNGRDAGELNRVAGELRSDGAQVEAVAGDASDASTIDELVSAARRSFGSPDLLVANAAMVASVGPLLRADEAKYLRMTSVNSWAPVRLVQCAFAGGDDSPASVVMISAGAARSALLTLGQYAASKAALEALTRCLAAELGPAGVRVNAVSPGLVRTNMAGPILRGDGECEFAARLPLRRVGEPEDIAAAVAFLLSADASWITGVVLDVDGGSMLVGPPAGT